MQAIETKYHGPTNTRGGRIKATCEAGSVTVDYDHRHNPEENHRDAAGRLCAKLKWTGRLIDGALRNGVRVHVFAEE